MTQVGVIDKEEATAAELPDNTNDEPRVHIADEKAVIISNIKSLHHRLMTSSKILLVPVIR